MWFLSSFFKFSSSVQLPFRKFLKIILPIFCQVFSELVVFSSLHFLVCVCVCILSSLFHGLYYIHCVSISFAFSSTCGLSWHYEQKIAVIQVWLLWRRVRQVAKVQGRLQIVVHSEHAAIFCKRQYSSLLGQGCSLDICRIMVQFRVFVFSRSSRLAVGLTQLPS